MKYETMRFFSIGRSLDWSELGVLVRRADEIGRMRFLPAPGFEIPAAEVVRNSELASDAGNADQLWDYYRERGLGGLSSVGEPVSMEAERAEDIAASLYTVIADDPGTRSD